MSEEELDSVEENEFESLDVDEQPPGQEFAETPDNDLIDSGSAGVEYDWSKAPEGTSAPPRIDLDGETVTIKEAKIVLPPKDRPWMPTKSGNHKFKPCTFKLFYNKDGQQEFYSGVKVFKRNEGYSHPTIYKDGKSQAAKLMKAYAKFRSKDINEVSLKEFMSFLNGKPKGVIEQKGFKNPEDGEVVKKNMIVKFVE